MARRFTIEDVPSSNGTHSGHASKGKGAKKGPQHARGATKPNSVRYWAYAGIGLTLTLSGWLNGMAFAQHAPSPAAGWALGVAIPVLVLVFSRVSALLYMAGRRWVATAGAGATGAILLLSVQHLASAIACLTGEAVWCAALMALAVDVGLVVCELATIRR